ncbi:zinc ribbon domain-containing protein [Rubripirellula amarantea]|uniref:zinc ribbon domain-containing protein n=1 Tax=Rubripirellula amarantea TaxID=2527999 RepID=UPI0011B80232|nr:zinc ribbon domain-containing protein [Rubripirellula amarantea]
MTLNNQNKSEASPLNEVPCPHCGVAVDDRAPACPNCGEKIYVEHPGGITPTKHRQIPMNRPPE